MLSAVLAAALVVWGAFAVPSDMDEFAPLHLLSCRYLYAPLHTFREGCGGGAETLRFGAFEYQRAYAYVGATSSALYFPIWRMWASPRSFYALGIVLLALFAVGLTRALRLPLRDALIPLSCFPIVYLFIHDTGPIRLAFLSLPAFVLLWRGALRRPAPWRQLAYGVAAGVVAVVCTEDKPFYLVVSPLIGLCAVAGVTWEGGHGDRVTTADALRRGWLFLVALATVASSGISVLLFGGRDGNGNTYYQVIRGIGSEHLSTLGFQIKRIVVFTLLPAMNAHRVFGWDHALIFASTPALVPAGVLVWFAVRRRALDRVAVFWLGGAYAVGAAVFLATHVASEAHHYVFLLLPILVALMMIASRSEAAWRMVMACAAASSVLAMAALTWHAPTPSSSRGRDRLFEYLCRPGVASRYVLNFSSWGGYYQQALYGDPAQLVTYIEPLTRADASRLSEIAHSLSRGVLDICRGCTRASVAASFGVADVTSVELGLEHWHVFEVRPPEPRPGL